MRTLRGRLISAFLVVILSGAVFLWVGALWATKSTFQDYVTKQHEAKAVAYAILLGQYYAYNGSWIGSELMFERGHHGKGMGRIQQPQGTDRILLFDAAGNLVFDTRPDCIPAPSVLFSLAKNITVENVSVGSVVVAPASPTVGALGILEDEFLSRVEKVLMIAGVLSIAVGLVGGLRFSARLARPVEALEQAAIEVADGNLGQQAVVDLKGLPGEITRLLQSFNGMSAKLKKADTKNKELVRDLAHEIRTPLTILQGNLEAASIGAGELDRVAIESMLEEVGRLSGLVDNLGRLDKAAGVNVASLQPVLSQTLVQKAAMSVQGIGEKNGFNTFINVVGSPGKVYVDPKSIHQVFSNLLSNAIRYTPKNGTIEIGAKRHSSSYILFWVKDSGPGVSEQDLDKLFERFYRGDPSRTRATGGQGLGLAIAKELVENYGGTIWAENHNQGGAVLYFTLPVFSQPHLLCYNH